MILWEKSDCSPDWTELLSILADLAKLTEKCSKNCGLLPNRIMENPHLNLKICYGTIYSSENSFILWLIHNNRNVPGKSSTKWR